MRVLVTGATGHFGPSLCKAFLKDGAEVRVLLHQRKIKGMSTAVETMWGDITQPNSIKNM